MPDDRQPRYAGPTITSTSNERIRFVRSLYKTSVRRHEGLFVVEGVRLVEEALDAGVKPELVLVAPEQLDRTPRGQQLHERVRAFNCWLVTEPVLKALSDTMTPQGILAVLPVPPTPTGPLDSPVVLILDQVRDPGNAGTVLRSAAASGVVRTVAFVNSVDAYSPKVVRAAMGAHFRLDIWEDATWSTLLSRLADRPRWLSVAQGGVPYDRVDWTKNCALILGGEAEGAGPEADAAASGRVTIPMAGSTESLNAAMAGTVLLFEAARVRRTEGEGASPPTSSATPQSVTPRRPIPAPPAEKPAPSTRSLTKPTTTSPKRQPHADKRDSKGRRFPRRDDSPRGFRHRP